MGNIKHKDLLDAGVHFGHLTRKWDPRMAPYIFMEKNGIHIIDLNKTIESLEQASNALGNIVRSGRKVMFVATKKQAKEIVVEEAKRLNMPYVTERWLGGMLTNFSTIRKSLKKMTSIERLMKEEAYTHLAKRERLMITREKLKLERILGGIADLTRLPAALFVVDVKREHIAIKEAQKLNIPVFAMVDTNSDPTNIDFPIPANDDAFKSIDIITKEISSVIEQALMERKKDKDEAKRKEEEEAKRKVDEQAEGAEKSEKTEKRVRAEKVDTTKGAADKTEVAEKA
jgi:small subunit ribosomal protein S2